MTPSNPPFQHFHVRTIMAIIRHDWPSEAKQRTLTFFPSHCITFPPTGLHSITHIICQPRGFPTRDPSIIPHQQDMLTIYYLPIIDLVCLASVACTAQYTKFSTDKQLPQSSMQCGCSCMPSFSSIKWMRGIWTWELFFFLLYPSSIDIFSVSF